MFNIWVVLCAFAAYSILAFLSVCLNCICRVFLYYIYWPVVCVFAGFVVHRQYINPPTNQPITAATVYIGS